LRGASLSARRERMAATIGELARNDNLGESLDNQLS
jgi:hypothetical protein